MFTVVRNHMPAKLVDIPILQLVGMVHKDTVNLVKEAITIKVMPVLRMEVRNMIPVITRILDTHLEELIHATVMDKLDMLVQTQTTRSTVAPPPTIILATVRQDIVANHSLPLTIQEGMPLPQHMVSFFNFIFIHIWREIYLNYI